MEKELYVVTLSEKIWAEATVAVRADSMEEAARLALEGAHYDMTRWLICYDYDHLDDTMSNDVSTATQDDVEYADQKHLLDGNPLLSVRLDEGHERAISQWREMRVQVGRWLEELKDSDFFSGHGGEGRVYEP